MIITTSTFLKWYSPYSQKINLIGIKTTYYIYTHTYICMYVCMHSYIQTMILNTFSTQQQLTAWLTFMAPRYVTVNESANGNMFPYILQKSSITKATQNTAFLSDINYEFCSRYGFATGKRCCTPLLQPIARISLNCLLSSTISNLQTINWVIRFTLHSLSANAGEYHKNGLYFPSNIQPLIWTLTLTFWLLTKNEPHIFLSWCSPV
jgi:hypothetical protein